MMTEKLGLVSLKSEEDFRFIAELDRVMQLAELDWTIFFRNLAKVDPSVELNNNVDFNYQQIQDAIYGEAPLIFIEAMKTWLRQYVQLIRRDSLAKELRIDIMNKSNPKFIPRNYLLYQVIQDLEAGSTKSLQELYSVLKNPYAENPELEHLAVKRPDWAKNTAGSSTLSCSS
jgi:uncharacterized protein YdiU (UPF0061 family)